jgi:hypothetical protein
MNARVFGIVAGLMIGLAHGAAQAADIINQDKKAYKVTVVGVGSSSPSYFNIKSGGSQYGMCNSNSCTFAIPGSKVTASRNGVMYIRGGKLLIQKP